MRSVAKFVTIWICCFVWNLSLLKLSLAMVHKRSVFLFQYSIFLCLFFVRSLASHDLLSEKTLIFQDLYFNGFNGFFGYIFLWNTWQTKNIMGITKVLLKAKRVNSVPSSSVAARRARKLNLVLKNREKSRHSILSYTILCKFL